MRDEKGRTIDYIRISVTDRCNFRCIYCMPEDGVEEKFHEEILSYEEILKICRAGVRLGIRKVKITGGEPLVRRDICQLVEQICSLKGIEDVTMTTNGFLLGDYAEALKKAGLSSVNVSLDTLDADEFAKVTRRHGFTQVMEGIHAAVRAGLRVKINCAVMRELGQQELSAFAALSSQEQIPVRFIEMMPIGQGKGIKTCPNDDLAARFAASYPDWNRVERDAGYGNGPARYYTFDGGKGCIGFISAVHHQFCSGCNRVRLTADGFLKLCLDSEAGVDLRQALRSGCTDEALMELMETHIRKKPESHHFLMERADRQADQSITMNQIGG